MNSSPAFNAGWGGKGLLPPPLSRERGEGTSLTIQPILVVPLNILIMNEPSPEVNPANQFGSIV